MGHWFRVNKFNDFSSNVYKNGSAYKSYKACGAISDEMDDAEQINGAIEELEGSFLSNIAELLSDYLSEQKKWKTFTNFWQANKFNYTKYFNRDFILSSGSDLSNRFFSETGFGLQLNDELKDMFKKTYDSYRRGPKDQKVSAYDQDHIYYRDSQFNSGGPSTGLLGTSNQNIGNKEPMDIQFPMRKITPNNR